MGIMDHVGINNKVTLKTLEINRTPDVIGSVIQRLTDVYDMCKEHMTKEQVILDLGTKDCLFFDVLVEKGFEKRLMVGIDCCKEVCAICHEKSYLVLEGDIQNMTNIKPEYFDFIFIVHTLEHVPNPKEVIDKCAELLKPNGFVFVEVPIQSQIDDPELWGHYHPFTAKNQVKDLFADYDVVKEDWQKTKSKSPWYRVLFQKR